MKPVMLDSLQICWCEIQGHVFEIAWSRGYRMAEFVRAFMNSKLAERFDSRYDSVQWMCEERLLEKLLREVHLVPQCRRDDVNPEMLFWSGYLYRFWHIATGENSKTIYRTAPLEVMRYVYAGYHTLSCEMAVEWLKRDAKSNKAA